MRADVLTEENVNGGPADKSRKAAKLSATAGALALGAARLNLPLCAVSLNSSTTGRLNTASEPFVRLHGLATERTLKWNSPWTVISWQLADVWEGPDSARHSVPEQADAQSGPAKSASVTRHATTALLISENRFAWPIVNMINPFASPDGEELSLLAETETQKWWGWAESNRRHAV